MDFDGFKFVVLVMVVVVIVVVFVVVVVAVVGGAAVSSGHDTYMEQGHLRVWAKWPLCGALS